MKQSIKKLIYFVLPGVLIFIASGRVFAQTGYLNARNLSLGGGGTAYMTGYESAFINPANLGLFRGNNQILIGLPGDISIKAGGSLANVTTYNKYFTKGLTFDESTANNILNDWFGSSQTKMKDIGANVDIVPLAFVHKTGNTSYGLALRFRTLANVSVNKGMAGLILHGMDSNYFANGRPVNFTQTSYSVAELAFSYSRKLNLGGFLPENQAVYIGVTPKLIGGISYENADFQSNLKIMGDSLVQHQFKYTVNTVGALSDDMQKFYQQRMDPNQSPNFDDLKPQDMFRGGLKGTGFGLDLGVTYIYNFDTSYQPYTSNTHGAFLTLSASVTDIGSVKFKKNAMQFVADNSISWDGLKPSKEEINSKYNGSTSDYIDHVLKDSIATDIYGSFVPNKVTKLRVGLPATIHLGAYLKYGKFGFTFDTGKGMNNYGMNSTNGYMVTGLEYYFFSFLPLRVGYLLGGKTSNSFSVGTGLEFRNFQFGVGAMTVNNSVNRGYNLSTAVSARLLFY